MTMPAKYQGSSPLGKGKNTTNSQVTNEEFEKLKEEFKRRRAKTTNMKIKLKNLQNENTNLQLLLSGIL